MILFIDGLFLLTFILYTYWGHLLISILFHQFSIYLKDTVYVNIQLMLGEFSAFYDLAVKQEG